MNGTDDYVGGLIGLNYGMVTASYATGQTSGDEVVGGLLGLNSSTVSASYATGRITGREIVGGLVGYNDGTIEISYANAIVVGERYVGGLVGNNLLEVVASYSMGRVTGKRRIGGLVGHNNGEGTAAVIFNTYTTSAVVGHDKVGGFVGENYGAVIDGYWDIQATGQTTGAGENEPSNMRHFPRHWWDGEVQIVGKTTSQLQEPTRYSGIYARWNRSPEDMGFTEFRGSWNLIAVWDFGTSDQYPALRSDFDGDGRASWQEFGSQARELSQPVP